MVIDKDYPKKDYSKDLMSLILEQKVRKFLEDFDYRIRFKNNDLTSFYITHKNVKRKLFNANTKNITTKK